MKHRVLGTLIAILIGLFLVGCSGASDIQTSDSTEKNKTLSESQSEISSSDDTPLSNDDQEEDDTLILPGGPGQSEEGDTIPEDELPEESQTKSAIYPPSIFVIEASGKWRQELAPGYYADYECEFYACLRCWTAYYVACPDIRRT